MEKSGYGRDGIFRSLRPPIVFPRDPNLSVASFIFRNSSSYPNRLAIVDAESSDSVSYSQLKASAIKISNGLLQLGIEKNDVVMIFAPNSVEFSICFIGIVAIGAIVTTCNPVYMVSELTKQVRDAKPKLMISVVELWDKVKVLNIPTVLLDQQIPSEIQSSKILCFNDLINMAGDKSSSEFPIVGVKQSDTAALLYSSGTTGASKGVILTHRNLITSSLMITLDQKTNGDENGTYLNFLPMFHVFGLVCITCAQLQRGNTIVSMPKFNLEKALWAVEKYKVTDLWVVPPVVLALAKQSVVKKYNLSSLKHIGSGAAPLGKELMDECANNIPSAVVLQVPCSRLFVFYNYVYYIYWMLFHSFTFLYQEHQMIFSLRTNRV